jgi:hypothetical protein
MSPVLQGSALRRAPDPADTKFHLNGAREPLIVLLDSGSAANRLDEPGFAGSALRRAPESAASKFHLSGGIRCGREPLSVLLDSGSATSRLNELGFAGVCPTASP